MGTGCEVGLPEYQEGILPRAVRYLFDRMASARQRAEDAVCVSETEEEVASLLSCSSRPTLVFVLTTTGL